MKFPFNVYLATLLGAFLVSIGALPVWRRICIRNGLVDDPGHRKIHGIPIPLAGGLSVLTGILFPLLFGLAVLHARVISFEDVTSLLSYGFNRRITELIVIFVGAIGMIVIGWLDDKFELPPLVKFGGQLVIASLVALANVRITLFIHNTVFSYGITILWILTMINAFNFMDNMNGLCTGLGAIASGYFGIISAIEGQYLVALLALLSLGALLGFLPYNFPKASAFLGDAGSHLVGFLLAVMAILPHFYTPKHPHPWAVLTPLFVLAVPLGDLICVVLIRSSHGQPFYIGDNNHLSHRLVRKGLSHRNAVLLIWALAALIGAVPVLLLLSSG
ncbi:MraY family glycosyltransferase [Pedosphaera parvula]|uniref:Glycosyl transferase family 4 n=1 Tax=Pedosphaera parvula (strain Ellin514) TaxID=320771 RepID=B9XDX2_PEDPL|nr:MraY family glycosyltransferase [Pedosphaera parvula]EEF61863.1 glycosyl transferase family 4 [Pedosphaera parvula Ellin514]